MLRKIIASCAVAIAGFLPPLGHAEMRQIASHGAWTAYAGQSDRGHRLCTISAQGNGRWLGMKYFAGDSKLTVHLMNRNWSGRAGQRVPLTAEFDTNGTWSTSAESFTTSDGQLALEFSVSRDSLEQWLREFAGSHRLFVRFPEHRDVADWTVSLDGSEHIAAPLLACIAATAESGAQTSQRMRY